MDIFVVPCLKISFQLKLLLTIRVMEWIFKFKSLQHSKFNCNLHTLQEGEDSEKCQIVKYWSKTQTERWGFDHMILCNEKYCSPFSCFFYHAKKIINNQWGEKEAGGKGEVINNLFYFSMRNINNATLPVSCYFLQMIMRLWIINHGALMSDR